MNLLITTGRLTKDAVVRFTAKGDSVAGFTVATDIGYGDNKHALFIDCSVWGKRAEALEPYLKKGTAVTVSGEADLREWESNGKHGANITLRVNDVVLQGGGKPADKPSDSGFRKPIDARNEPTQDDFDASQIPF